MNENLDELRAEVVEHGLLDYDQAQELLERVEAAEREAKAAKGALTQSIAERALDTHHAAGIAVDEAVKGVVKLIVEDPSRRAREAEARAEAAEAAVQRVRDMHKPTRDPFGESCAVCVGDSRRNPYPCDTIRALDGGE